MFNTIAQATWVGSPDSPGTAVIYLLSQPYSCKVPDWAPGGGWDGRVPSGAQIIELKTAGNMPATFSVTSVGAAGAQPPPAGMAYVHWSLHNGATPVEVPAVGTTVTIDTVNPKQNITGTFSLSFGGHMVSGSYNAAYCPGAGEP